MLFVRMRCKVGNKDSKQHCYYQAYAESHENDPREIRDGFKELDKFLEGLSLDNNNAVWNLCCQLCTAYEHKAFVDGIKYGAHLMMELKN